MAERESLYLWSTTAGNNGAADPSINYAEGQLPGTLNNSNRSHMAAIARDRKDTNGSLTSGGSGSAYTLTVNSTITAYATGHRFSFKANHTNNGPATLNVTNADAAALGVKAIRGPGDTALTAGQIISGTRYDVVYDTAYNSAAGAFILLNPSITTGATDNAALRADGTGGASLQSSALVIADTTGALSRVGNGGIPVQGTNTNDSAASGFVGEYLSQNAAVGSTVALTTATGANVASVSLTPGDWDTCGTIIFPNGGTTRIFGASASISTTSATADTSADRMDRMSISGSGGWVPGASEFRLNISGARMLVDTTTTAYLVANCIFDTSSLGAYGKIWARRVR